MSTVQRVLLCALAAGVPAWAVLRAQDPPAVRSTGHVLLLQNQGILEGEIERHAGQFRVRRGGGETWVAAERVLWLCADWEEAFAFLSRQANLHDADERVRLALWCDHNGLREHALAEAEAAVRLRAEHAGARRLLERLRNTAKAPAAAGKPAEPAEEPAPAVDLNAESLAVFTSRVQPILMNACACCHATGRGGKFKLMRCYDATVNRRGLYVNLAAVLAQIDLDEPPESPLLYKAFSAHGGPAKAPLGGRQSTPYQILEDWVATVVANNPHLRKVLGKPKKTAEGSVTGPTQPSETERAPMLLEAPQVSRLRPAMPAGLGPEEALVTAPTAPPVAAVAGPAPVQAAAADSTQTTPRDEFDPWIFNTKLRPPR
jgi:hypothetical protein